jgi:ABC-2 type transport system permease protein
VSAPPGGPPRSTRGPFSWPLVQLTLARLREFLREPEAIFWVFLFPLLLAIALGVAFRNRPPEPLPVGIEESPLAEARLAALEATKTLAPQILTRPEAEHALATGKLTLVVLGTDPPTYWFDPTRPDSRLARLEVDQGLEQAAGRVDLFTPQVLEMTERGARYIDFLVPGLLGMNLMGTGMWSIGFSLVQQRAGKLLKLFIASPMRRWQLLAAQVLARLVFLTLEVSILLGFAVLVLDVPMRGAVASVAVVSVLGALSFVGLGLLVAARPRTIEGVSGLMNLVMFPMWIFSGVFFSNERFPAALQPFIQILPLTALNDSLRAVMLEGAALASQLPELAILAGWGLIGFAGALKLFRWT